MGFEVRTEFGNLDPEAKRALVAMQHAIKGHLDQVDQRVRRPKRAVSEVVEEGGVLAKPGQVVRVRPNDTDVKVVLPTPDAGNGGEDIIVSFEGDGTATGKVIVEPANSTCANPGTTTLNTPGTYRFTSTGAPGEDPEANGSTWGGPAPLSLDDLPDIATGKVLGNNTGSTGAPIELTGSQVLDLVGSTRGSVLERGAAGWTAITPGAIELPIVSKGAGADPVYQQLATAGIQDDAVTNAKLANMATAKLKGRTTAGTGDPEDLTPANSTSNTWNVATGGSISVERAALTGDVTASANANATTIANNAVTNAKAADMASPRLKGRTTASTGDPEDLTLVNSTSVTWNTGTGGSISVERAALTGEVTASANANACTVTRSTNFQSSPWTGSHAFAAGIALTGANAHSTWAAQQDDFALGAVAILRGAQTGDQSLTGMVPAFNGQLCIIKSSDSADVLAIPHANASSSAANQFDNPRDATVAVQPGGAILCYYDSTLTKWCPVLTDAGDGLAARYSALSSVTNSSSAVTVASLSIPANFAVAGTCVEFFGSFSWTRGSTATAVDVTIELTINGTQRAFYTTRVITTSGLSGDASIHGFINFLAVGATGQIRGRLAQQETAPFGATSSQNGIVISSIDTTSAITVAVDAFMSGAVANVTLTGTGGLVQVR